MSESVRLILDTAECHGPMRSGSRRFWTGREDLIMRNTFPAAGVVGCLEKLPGRTPSSIYQRARTLHLKAPTESGPRHKWKATEALDALIRRTYEGKPEKGAIKELARQTGRPRSWLNDRATKLGCVVPRFKEPRWTEAEKHIVHENAHRHPATIQKALKGAGYSRTETAITVQRKRLGACTDDPDHYTSRGLGLLFGLDESVVRNWIAAGWLVAKRRGTARVATQGGDQWWIHRKAVRAFVIENTARVDLRKVDKFWFVELLTSL